MHVYELWLIVTAHPQTDIQAIYRYQNNDIDCASGDSEIHTKNIGNKMLLWHGTNTSNLLGTMKLGLGNGQVTGQTSRKVRSMVFRQLSVV